MIETQSFSISYTADGSQTEWAFPYPYLSSNDIKLYVVINGIKTLVDPTYYSFDTTTNLITYPLSGDPVASGTVLYLERQTPLTQLEDSSLGNFKSNDIERMADKLTMISQEVTKAAGELYIDDALSETSENAVQNKVITAQIATINSSKQDTISDLSTIRSGAAAGATALQSGNNISSLVNDAGYLTSHQDISDRAKTNFDNITMVGTSSSAGWAMPSTTYVSITPGASGATYTAPANGFFHAVCGAAIQVANLRSLLSANSPGTSVGGGACWVPARKNDNVFINYSTTDYLTINFVYAEGSKSEAN